MAGDRLLAYEEPLPDFTIALARSDQPEDLQFARAQRAFGLAGGLRQQGVNKREIVDSAQLLERLPGGGEFNQGTVFIA